MPIQVETWDVAARHAVDDTIWIDHWDDDELERIKKILANLINLAEEIANEVLCNKGACGFARVLPC